MLCSACTAIFQGHDSPWYYIKEENQPTTPAYFHHASPVRLAKAVKRGCHICTIIWRKLEDDEKAALLATWKSPYLHRFSQAVQRLWTAPIAYYSWSPIWFSKDDFGIRFQFGDAPFWKKIVFRLLPLEVEDRNDSRRESKDITTTQDAPPKTSFTYEPDHEHTLSLWTPLVQKLVQHWFTECTSKHEFCKMGDRGHVERGHVHGAFEPTRILDLNDGKIRLSTDPDERKAAPYASLTHRWSLDPSTMPRLNDQNVHEWRKSIDPKILTATFRDAIAVARMMNIRYIWIDSLCIQQTGPGWEEDWHREAAIMGEVYRHAFINIQAGRDVDNVTWGLFHAPNDRDILPYNIAISRHLLKPHPHRSSAADPTPIHLQGTFSIIEEDFARDELLGNPINRRGWVLQERLLSHRILHFGAQQVFWECRQLLACETFPTGLPKTIPKTMARAATQILKTPTTDFNITFAQAMKQRSETNASSATRRESLTRKNLPLPSFPSLTVRRDLFAWFYLAELYSACTLTFASDKLVAISGLAAIFGSPSFSDRAADVVAYLRSLAIPRSGQAITSFADDFADIMHAHYGAVSSRAQSDYLAGLWRDELIPCLLWHVGNGRQVDGHPSQRIKTTPRAPSWSWASVNGLLHASIYQNWSQGIEGMQLAEVSYADTAPVSAVAPWGAVSGGKILVAGKIVHERDIRWPDPDEVDPQHGHQNSDGGGGNGDVWRSRPRPHLTAHRSEVHASMVKRMKMNSASVARVRTKKADVIAYVDDVEEFAGRLRRSRGGGRPVGGGGYEVALLPLIGLQRRRADWSEKLGYVDEVFEWHGLVVKLSGRRQSRDLLTVLRSQEMEVRKRSVIDLQDDGMDNGQLVGERLGYFRVRDTDVFGQVLNKGVDREIVLV